MPATISLPERRVNSIKEKETKQLISNGKVQTIRNVRNSQTLVETLLGKLQTSTRKPLLLDRSVVIPRHLVPGCMRADHQKKVAGSMTLVYVGSGTE